MSEMSESFSPETVIEIIAGVLNMDPEEIHTNDTFVDDLGADSLDLFQIVMQMEEKFKVEIPAEETETIVTVGDAIARLKERL